MLYNDPGSGTEGIRIVASFENEHFLIWMRIAAIPSFLKLYAKIDEDMDSGVYRIQVENSAYLSVILNNRLMNTRF